MYPFWSMRVWDMYVDAYYAKIKVDFEKETHHWTMIISKRFWRNDGKWYGL